MSVAPACVAQLVGALSCNRSVVSIPGLDTYDLWTGCVWKTTSRCFPLTLMILSLASSLKTMGKNVLYWEFFLKWAVRMTPTELPIYIPYIKTHQWFPPQPIWTTFSQLLQSPQTNSVPGTHNRAFGSWPLCVGILLYWILPSFCNLYPQGSERIWSVLRSLSLGSSPKLFIVC